MKLADVEKRNWFYLSLRPFVDFFHNHVFYKKVHVRGLENIPKDEPVIFAPNHQNALMDAMAILCVKYWEIVYLARADMFKKPTARKALFFLKILPVFRMRDGKDALKQNDKVFDKAASVVLKKRLLTVFPEASHLGIRKLRPLKKGVTRIALLAEEKTNFNTGVKIIPVGINYQNYFKMRNDLFIDFGKPIKVNKYKESYQENPQKANNELISEIGEGLSKLIINIRSKTDYDEIDLIRNIYTPKMLKKLKLKNNFKNKIIADKKTIETIEQLESSDDEKYHQLIEKAKKLNKKIKLNNIPYYILNKSYSFFKAIIFSLLMIISFPIYAFGAVNNYIPYALPQLITRKIKDLNFHTSIRFVLYLVTYTILIYPIIFLLVHLFTDIWWIKWIYALLLPITGLFAFHYVNWFKTIKKQWKCIFNKKNHDFIEMMKLNDEILNEFDNFVKF